ncbi:tetraacyldisaccharide 4'-kinase [Sungkyunkwania multivorans]|uniref:Tetraacyldisaccharide 4'-kinase n=1 Tax=Sungkyunkwania multivorans TaxID=1173618 RepID=A0ABW3CXW2_9FLAO
MRSLRKILWPFSIIYDLVTWLRNLLYDWGIFKSTAFDLPIICVGNLSVGGTGKTPMIEYLIALLDTDYHIATLSRGYGRKTKGYRLATEEDDATTVGDEPLQFFKKFKEIDVAVAENRVIGIKKLIDKETPPQVILLDDAFQHRRVKAGLNMMLTAYDDIFYKDLVLPAGSLRESKRGARRADVIVVTKCPENLSNTKQLLVASKIGLKTDQKLFFSTIAYSDDVLGIDTKKKLSTLKKKAVLLITGIAKPAPLLTHLEKEGISFKHLAFSDHHNFSEAEIEKIRQLSKGKEILTTEKDFLRLHKKLKGVSMYYLPISVSFLGDTAGFESLILEYVDTNKKKA